MAMDGAILKTAAQTRIYTKLKSLFEGEIPVDATPETKAKVDENWVKISDAISECMLDIVLHIQTYAQVNSTLTGAAVTVTSVSGVMTGPGVSGPGTGVINATTSTGTIA